MEACHLSDNQICDCYR